MESTAPDHHPKGVQLEFFDADPASPDFDAAAYAVAVCYQQTYGLDPAWSEGRKCEYCSTPKQVRKWNLRTAPDACDTCGRPTKEFWPIPGIIGDMRAEMQRPDAVFVVARMGVEIIGGCWGFSASPEELEEHLNHGVADEAQVRGVADYLRAMHVSRVAYQDEIFVKPGMQGLGIGRKLFLQRYRGFRDRGLDHFMLRTKMNPPSNSYLWFGARWRYAIVGRYPDADQRVVLAANASHIDRYVHE